MASHECGHRRFPTNMPLADSPHRGHQGAPANGGGRCWVAGRGHAPPEGGCGRWPAGALPRWLPFLVKQVLKQATTCFRTAKIKKEEEEEIKEEQRQTQPVSAAQHLEEEEMGVSAMALRGRV